MDDNIETEKVDSKTLGVVETIPEQVLPKVNFTIAFLKQQLLEIKAQRESQNAARDAEIEKVQLLLDECSKLGITE